MNPNNTPTQSAKRRYPPSVFLIMSAVMFHMIASAEEKNAFPNPENALHFWEEIPRSPSTKVPAEIKDGYWNSEFQRVNREVQKVDKTEIIIFGDSITWGWSLGEATGLSVWKDFFLQYNPINMGNSGDITPVMLYRGTHGNLDFAEARQPKVAVLLCGINNFGVTQSAGGKEKWDLGINCPPADIADGRRALAQLFRRRLPKTRVILMAILPVANAVKWEKCKKVNALNAALERNEDEVVYADLQASFLLPDGSFNKKLFSDGIHLTPEGYLAWAKGLEPIVSKFMKSPPLKPVKIMLIGDSITEGADSNRAYRRYLDGMLRRHGHLIDFVGSRKKHKDNATEADNYEYDLDHEGHWGKDSAWMAENIPQLLNANVPDVAVVQIGAMDVSSSKAAPEPLTDGILRNIDKVVGALRSKNEKVNIILSKIVPMASKKDVSELLNLKIARYVQSHSTPARPLFLADLSTGIDSSLDLDQDGMLPAASGARKMARVLADAISIAIRNVEHK